MPSNLKRPPENECITHGHFRSRDKHYPLEIYRICESELPTSRLSKVIVWQTDRQTEPKSYTTPFWSSGQSTK